ncbi:MAG: LysR family transcriptional regulator [Bacteriovoracia bacterium]
MRWLNYNHLYYFQVIANEGSISAASKKLLIGQPALSAQLKTLEESLGKKLFERKNRALYLTEAGQVLLEYANHIVKLGDEALQVLGDEAYSPQKKLHLGVAEFVPKTLTREMIKASQKMCKCQVNVIEGDVHYLIKQLTEHHVDIILTDSPPEINPHAQLNVKHLGGDDIAIFATKNYLHLREGFPQSLENVPVIMPTMHSKLRHDLRHFFNTKKISIDVAVEAEDTGLQKILGIAGMGVVPLPRSAGKEFTFSEQLHLLGKIEDIQQDFWLITTERKITNPVTAMLLEEFTLDSWRKSTDSDT